MRLIDIKRSINIAYENFHPKYSDRNGNYYIDNIQTMKVAIQELYNIGIIEYKENSLDMYSIVMSCITDRLVLDGSQINGYKNEFGKMEYTLKLMYKWINDYVTTEETEETINIKLPQIHNLEDIIESCKLINKSLSQSVAEIGGTLKFKQLDYGSSWIIISVGATVAAGMVMSIAKAAYYVAQRFYAIKLIAKQYERYAMGNEVMKTIKEANERMLNEEIDVQARQLESQYYPESNNERLGRLRVSINEMYKLIELGGEVHPSLILKNDTKDTDIDYKQLLNFNKEMGLLPKEETPDNDKQPQ